MTLEIDVRRVEQELTFWRHLEFVRLQRTRQMGRTEWLKGPDGAFIHLFPIARLEAGVEWAWGRTGSVPRYGHVAIVPKDFEVILRWIGKSVGEFVLQYEWLSDYWGARRVCVYSPSGHRVEVMEFAPSVKWPAAPEED